MSASPRSLARALRHVAVLGTLVAAPLTAASAQIFDPPNDWLPSYTGPKNPLLNGDLDVLQAAVYYDGTNFTFTHRSAGNIGSTTGASYVWGMNRGSGTARLAAFAPGVLFDWVLSITPGGAITTRDLISNVTTTIDASQITISGATLTAVISGSLLPSTGFTFANYTANIWPRVPGTTQGIADFAPDNPNFAVTVTPEPSSVLLMGGGLVALLAAHRRRRNA